MDTALLLDHCSIHIIEFTSKQIQKWVDENQIEHTSTLKTELRPPVGIKMGHAH